MKKRFLSILIAFSMLFFAVGCEKKEKTGKTNETVESPYQGSEIDPGTEPSIEDDVLEDNSAEPEAFADAEAAAYHTPTPNATAVPVATPVPTKAPAPEEETEEDADAEGEGNYTPSVGLTEYERYNAMSGEEQQAFMESFGSVEEFVAWYNSAREAYESGRIEIDGSEINAGDLVG